MGVEQQEAKSETEKRKVISDIETFDGKPREIEIKLDAQGLPKAMAFFDIDNTLAEFGFIHGESFKRLFAEIYPDEDPEEMAKVYLSDLGLGTTYRVFHRIIGIYRDKKQEWKDPKKYLEWLPGHEKEVDEEGPDHDLAAEYSKRHSQMGAQIAEELYKKNPQIFDQIKIKPVFQLVKILKKMGIPMAVMTANDEPFARSVGKCLGLANDFISLVHQKDFKGGKEIAIEVLIDKFRRKGIPIPQDIMVAGDSLTGDIGSGAKFMRKHEEFRARGVYVGEGDIGEMKKRIEENSNLKDMPVEVFDPSKVTYDQKGNPNLGLYRKKYSTKPKK